MTVKLCEKRSEALRRSGALFTLGEAASAVGARCRPEWTHLPVARVATDSRGDCACALFVALKGGRFDGHNYVREAFAKGACAAVVSELPPDAQPDWSLLVVVETLNALTDLASYYRSGLSIPVVGITGSCGKTTTKELLSAALSAKYSVAKPEASFNNVIGVSLTVLSVRPHHDVLVLELGTNAPGEIEALCEIGRPTIGVITNIGHTHLEKLQDLDGVKKEKGSLVKFLGEGGVLVINTDCAQCKELADEFEGQTVTVATEAPADRLVAVETESERGLVFRYDGIVSAVPTAGAHNALNAGLAAAAAQILGVEPREALGAMARARVPAMRMERELVGGVLLVNDAYNSSFESLKAAVETLDTAGVPGRKILVCGDMLELGRAAESLHRAIGWHIGRSSVTILITVGPNAAFICEEAHKAGTEVIYQRNRVDEVGALLERTVKAGDVVLFKASRGMRLERAVRRLRRALVRGLAETGS